MEYVIVSYPHNRNVLIEGEVNGVTNDTLMVDTGTHTFALEEEGYRPRTVTKVVEDTTSLSPLRITDFHPV